MKPLLAFISVIGAAGLTLLLQVVLAHHLSAGDFGFFSLVNAVMAMTAPLASAGVSSLVLRRRIRGEVGGDLQVAAFTAFALSVVAAIVSFTIVVIGHGNALATALLCTFCIAAAAQSLSVSKAQSDKSSAALSGAQIGLPALRLLSVCLAVQFNQGLMGISVCLAAASCVVLAGHGVTSLRGVVLAPGTGTLMGMRVLAKDSVPFSLNAVVNVAQLQILVALSSALYGIEATGYFALTMTVVAAVYLLPNTVFGVLLLPKYHLVQPSPPAARMPLLGAGLAFACGILMVVLIFCLAPYFLSIAFADKAAQTWEVLRWVVLAVPFKFFSTALGATLLTDQFIRRKVVASLFAVCIQIVVCVALREHPLAAFALGMIVGEACLAVFYSVLFYLRFWR